MFPSTGHVPTPFHTCIRCGRLNDCSLYLLCQDCRDADLILADAAKFVAERDLEIWGDNPEGMETPMQIRASLGL